MSSLVRRSVAETVGTFAFVFLGAGSVVASQFPSAGYGLLGIALAHGIALAVMVTATMAISGGHLNPAVTIALLTGRRINGQTAIAYIAAQLVGAALAGFAIKFMLPSHVVRAVAAGTPIIANTLTAGQAIAIEALVTFFLASVVFGTCVNPDAPKVGGFAIGLVVFADILVAGPMTGAAMNPARAFGPALVSGMWTAQFVYWVGPILGGIVAALLWDRVLIRRPAGEE
ncbi:MAG: aquaporin [Gemmatimonadota bacterium]